MAKYFVSGRLPFTKMYNLPFLIEAKNTKDAWGKIARLRRQTIKYVKQKYKIEKEKKMARVQPKPRLKLFVE